MVPFASLRVTGRSAHGHHRGERFLPGRRHSAYRAALAIRNRRLDPGHPDVTNVAENLAGNLADQGRLEEAERLKRDVVERYRRLFPGGHPYVAHALQ